MTRRIPESEDEAYERKRQAEVDRIMTGPLKPCAHCGGEAISQEMCGKMFPARIFCRNSISLGDADQLKGEPVICGMTTPYVRTLAMAEMIWNRRAQRPPIKRVTKRNPLIDNSGGNEYAPVSHRRSTARGKASGSKTNRPLKDGQPKEK